MSALPLFRAELQRSETRLIWCLYAPYFTNHFGSLCVAEHCKVTINCGGSASRLVQKVVPLTRSRWTFSAASESLTRSPLSCFRTHRRRQSKSFTAENSTVP